MDLLQEEVIQHLVRRAGARLTAGYGIEAADGFRSELRPYLIARLPAVSDPLLEQGLILQLEERWSLIGHGLAAISRIVRDRVAQHRGNPAVFNAEARTALEAMVWPDGSMEHEESLLRVERLVALVRTRHENSPEELHTGIA